MPWWSSGKNKVFEVHVKLVKFGQVVKTKCLKSKWDLSLPVAGPF